MRADRRAQNGGFHDRAAKGQVRRPFLSKLASAAESLGAGGRSGRQCVSDEAGMRIRSPARPANRDHGGLGAVRFQTPPGPRAVQLSDEKTEIQCESAGDGGDSAVCIASLRVPYPPAVLGSAQTEKGTSSAELFDEQSDVMTVTHLRTIRRVRPGNPQTCR